MDNSNETTTKQLYQSFKDPSSALFLETSTKRLYELAKQDAKLSTVSYNDIKRFKTSVESISKSFEQRTLRSRQRHLQYRQWRVFGPLNILLGEYCTVL